MKAENTKPALKRHWFSASAVLIVATIVAIIMVAVVRSLQPQQAKSIVAAAGDAPPPVPTQVAVATDTVIAQAQPTQNPMGNCPSNWSDSKDPVIRDTCARLKGVISQQQRAAEIATMQAQPHVQTGPTPAFPTLLPPPDYAKVVQELLFNPYNGAWPFQWEGATSVWQIGAIPNSDYTAWGPLYLVAYQGNGVHSSKAYAGNKVEATSNQNPILQTMIFDSPGDGASTRYSKKWVFPQAVGDIYITNANIPTLNITDVKTTFPGLQGIVTFKTKDGQTGKFDLAKETWTFDSPSKTP